MQPKFRRHLAAALLALATLLAACAATVVVRDRQTIRRHSGLTTVDLMMMNCHQLDQAQELALVGRATQIHSSDPDGFFSANGQYRILRRGLFAYYLEYTIGPFPATHYFCEL